MKTKTIVCSTTSAQKIINAAREYFIEKGFEIQDIITENGEIGLQARKTSWLRKCSGTSYALQIIVKERSNNRYVVTAGWGEWIAKGSVVLFATFIAFGILIIPAMIGMANQASLPDNCLEYVTSSISAQNPLCLVYNEAKS